MNTRALYQRALQGIGQAGDVYGGNRGALTVRIPLAQYPAHEAPLWCSAHEWPACTCCTVVEPIDAALREACRYAKTHGVRVADGYLYLTFFYRVHPRGRRGPVLDFARGMGRLHAALRTHGIVARVRAGRSDPARTPEQRAHFAAMVARERARRVQQFIES